MGRLEGKVAFITGAARGQGRSHAVRLAQEGAHIICVDLVGGSEAFPWMDYPMATEDDLAETARLVEAAGQGIVARVGDVRNQASLDAAVREGLDKFGHIDIVSCNAGIAPYGPVAWHNEDDQWNDVIQVNLMGTRNTCRATVGAMIEAGNGGSITITSSGAGVQGVPHLSDYAATKHGVIGYARSLAQEVGEYNIRVNCIAPGTVNTNMIQNDANYKLFRPDLENPTKDDVSHIYEAMSLLKVPWVEPVDISNALLFLSSDEARYITGVVLAVDAGGLAKYP